MSVTVVKITRPGTLLSVLFEGPVTDQQLEQVLRVVKPSQSDRDRHERHVDLMASCTLCVTEAGDQPDRLREDDE
ncbi:MAG: hypothetical protein ACOYB2_11155 [Limnohabitans sp.]